MFGEAINDFIFHFTSSETEKHLTVVKPGTQSRRFTAACRMILDNKLF